MFQTESKINNSYVVENCVSKPEPYFPQILFNCRLDRLWYVKQARMLIQKQVNSMAIPRFRNHQSRSF